MFPPTVYYVAFVAVSLTASVFANSASYSTDSEFREYAKYPPQPFVRIADGCLYGTYKDGLESGQFEAFFGIPYAKPPVGKLRFRNPMPVEPWTGYYDATYERSKCVQKHDARPHSLVEGNEDCLYLNLYRPKYIIDPLPVIIFIHGGIYASGSASFAEFGPERLMDTGKVIVVVIQYRLGVFGFLSTGDSSSPGNYGLKDQSMALRWVQNNIQSFGGDPKWVLLAGQCAGGAAVQMTMMSPLSRGAFSTAVSMSGSVFDFWNYNIDQARLARRQAAAVGIRNAFNISTDKLVEELRWIDAYELGESVNRLKYFYVHPTGLYQPVVEQYVTKETFLSEDSRALWAAGKYEQIPWVTGFLSNDGAADSLGIITNVTLLEQLNENSRRFIPRLAGGYAQNNSTQMLKDRYFSDGTHERWLTRDNYLNLQTLTTESTVIYGIIKSVKLHQAKSSKEAPISVYYFNFRGRYSQSYVYSYTRVDFGVCHSDELLYLFRNTALAPDYPAGSPELVMAKELVDYYVKLVYNGITGPLCRQNDCQLLEFTNSNNPNSPVELKLVNGFDENMFNFWSEFYRLQEMGKHGVAY